MSDYDPGAPGGEQTWGSPQPSPPPTGGWGDQPGAGPPPGATPYGGPYGGAPPYGQQAFSGQQLPPYSQFGSPQANWTPAWVAPGDLASWGERGAGYLLDALIGSAPAIVFWVIYFASGSGAALALLVLASIWALAIAIWFAVQIGQHGSSPGMRVVGLRCVKADSGQLLGGGTALLRALIHWACSFVCFLLWLADMLWPLWDNRRQTLADKGVGSVVLKVPSEGFSLVPKSN